MPSIPPAGRRPRVASLALALALAFPIARVPAQVPSGPPAPTSPSGKKVLSVDDYSRWRNIEGAALSGDGKWVAYGLRFTNTLPDDSKPELHIRNLESQQEVTVANASNAEFSSDSRWIVYQVDSIVRPRGGRGGRGGAPGDTGAVTPPAPAPATGGRGGGGANTTRHRIELRELATGRTQTWHDMQSAAFSPNATHLVVRARAGGGGGGRGGRGGGGGGGGGGGAGNETVTPKGSDVVLHDLATGRSQFLGSVSDIGFNHAGTLLAYTVDATTRDGNGLFVIDLAKGRTFALDNDGRTYGRLAWTDDGGGLAALKGRAAERKRELDNVLIAFPKLGAALDDPELAPVTLDPEKAAGFPAGFVVSDRAPLQWSEDGARVFFGIIPQTAAVDTGRPQEHRLAPRR